MGRLILRKCSKEDYEIWAFMAAEVWRFLCKKKHDGGSCQVVVSVDRSRGLLLAFQEAKKKFQCSMSLGVDVGEKIWYPPEKGYFRLDVDAVVNANDNLFCAGAVVRDWQGNVKACLATPTAEPNSVLEAEINAISHGVDLCLQENLVPYIIFSDSLLAIRLFKGNRGGNPYLEEE
ncbi:hypothetical protein C2S52_004113 [Perilla frutescens var. hirtella]|nr:hypothetical protein C2S51_011438 [Perilla frutescens var. frutescens]KAH6793636.1 hypothetical protein C2S52_004113 [Perilla frutescens var. hirtella]